MKKLNLKSSVFKNNELIPSRFTCDGENISPPLSISGIPKNCQSLCLIVDDPDAPGRTFVHWVAWNISPQTKEILENSLPEESKEGITDFGQPGYGGPCPPSGSHRYFFKLYALDKKLEIEKSADKSIIEDLIKGHIIEETCLTGLYKRE